MQSKKKYVHTWLTRPSDFEPENLEREGDESKVLLAAIAEFDISLSGSQFLAELQTFLITNKGHTLCWLKILSKAPS